MVRVIYDLGANRGQNLAYYIKNADKVVAVEANPLLAEQICSEFSEAIKSGKLVVENVCITASNSGTGVNFFRHRFDSVLSKFRLFDYDDSEHFDLIQVESITPTDLIEKHGRPFFIKIDLEGLDYEVLKLIIEAGIIAEFLSVEIGGRSEILELLRVDEYKSFNFVAGYNVNDVYNFPVHSAGPFGYDIKSPWLSWGRAKEFHSLLKNSWCDIHCSTNELVTADEFDFSIYSESKIKLLRKRVLQLIPNRFKVFLKSYVSKGKI